MPTKYTDGTFVEKDTTPITLYPLCTGSGFTLIAASPYAGIVKFFDTISILYNSDKLLFIKINKKKEKKK